MRQDYAEFQRRGAEVIAIGPDGPRAFQKYWEEHAIPFPGLADLRSRVAARYEQEFNLFKFGRMPALFVIDRQGLIRFLQYGASMSDIPSNADVLRVIDEINCEEEV